MARRFTRKRWRRPQRLTLDGPPPARRKDIVVIDAMSLEPNLMWAENRRRVGGMIAIFVGASAVEGLLIGLLLRAPWLVAPALALSGLYLLVGSRLGDGWMLAVLQARIEPADRARSLLEAVCAEAGTSVPQLLVCPGDAPNAIALGLRRRTVLVTSGTLTMRDLELEALLAHEVVHFRGGDAAAASVYVLLAGAVELATKTIRTRRGLLALLAAPLWPACLAVRALGPWLASADRGARADVAGALLTRYPPGMRRMLLSAAVEQSDSTLRSTDGFWTAPRVPGHAAALHTRAARVAEM